MNKPFALSAPERRAVTALSGVYALRMMGLFIVLPILATAAANFPLATPFLIGMALGIHGLTQTIFQIPLGMLSDKVGRQSVIIGGMLVFVIGSVIAAMADTIYGLIIGRAVQGAGAVAAVIMAFASDLVSEQKRSKAMAIIGVSIGGAFIVSLMIGAPLESVFGLSGVFLFSAGSGLFAILVVVIAFRQLPTETVSYSRRIGISSIREVLGDVELLRLDIGIFILHLVMTANFLFLPVWIESGLSLPRSDHWQFYAPVLAGSFLLMLPALRLGERKHCINKMLPMMVLLLSASQALLYFLAPTPTVIILAMVMFFTAFNYLEANLPALTTRFCSADVKGTALSIFSQSQFLGIFAGGLFGGLLSEFGGHASVYLFACIITLVWAVWARYMAEPLSRSAEPSVSIS